MGFPLRQFLGGAGEVHGDKDGGGAAVARGKRGFWEGWERWQMPIRVKMRILAQADYGFWPRLITG